MAAEAARIFVDIETKGTQKADRNLKKIDGGLKKVDKSTEKLSKRTENFARRQTASFRSMRSAALAYVAVIAGAVAAFRAVLGATRRQEEANIRLRAVLRSTGEAAGLTYEQLRTMASGLQQVTTFGDEAIQEGQALLLTFTAIGSEVFPQALESALNLSTALGTDLQSSIQMVGKALNDPIRGMTRLSLAGVQFNDQQREQVRVMQEAGDIAGAQRVILGELETQFGGLARAMAETPFGRFEQLSNVLGDIAEQVGQEMLPGLALLSESLLQTAESGGGLVSIFRGLGQIIGDLAARVASLNSALNALQTGNIFDFAAATIPSQLPERQQRELRKALERARQMQQGIGFGSQGQGPLSGTTITTGTPRGGGPAITAPGGGTVATLESEIAAKRRLYEQDLRNYKSIIAAKDVADREASEQRLEQLKENFQTVLSIVGNIAGSISELVKMAGQNEITSIENTYKRRADLIKQNVKDEDKRALLLEKLEDEKNKKIRAEQRKQAEIQKKFAIFETLITTAQGALVAYAVAQRLGPIAGPIIGAINAAAVTALGAAKIALISSQPLPAAQFGGQFEVAPGFNADSGLLRVNSGEPVEVKPARTNEDNKQMILNIDGNSFDGYLTERINSILNSGQVSITRKGVVKVA
jgi:hypothetical protein